MGNHYSLLEYRCMTTQAKVESLIRQAAELPDEAQAELVQSLVEMRSQHLGIYHLDDEERAALARSDEDMHLGRFASDEEIDQMFARHGV
jgi:isoaspartyl peptidase/L-asparaginase-like protein (Ntn-hydrolase superfamily)